MRRTAASLLGAVLALSLTACGGGGGSKAPAAPTKQDYCTAVRALIGKHPAPAKMPALVKAVGNVAPGDVASDWNDITAAAILYAGQVRRSHQDPNHPPVGLTRAQTEVLNRRLVLNAYLTNFGPVKKQIRKVEADVKSRCGIKGSL